MRVTLARLAGLAALLLTALALTPAPAVAGGPTSALLSVPGAGSTASLYYTDPEYDELAALVGIAEPTGTFDGKESGPGHAYGAGVTVTWLVHDVEPWRVDRIYLGGKGGPWIATQVSDFDGSLWDDPVLWHQPPVGARLSALLDGLGLGTEASKDDSFDGVAGAPGPDSDSTIAAAPVEADPEPAAAGASAWPRSAGWALGGLVGGLVAGLVGGALLTLAWTRRQIATSDEAPSPREVTDGYAEVLAR